MAELGSFRYFLQRMRKEPHLVLPGALAWLNGWWYRFKFVLTFRKVRAGRFFRVYGRLNISGPGRVEFGDNCLIISNAIKPVCIRTLSANSVVRLGNSSGLNGTAIQCVDQVTIGELSNLADAYITDTSAHSLGENRRLESAIDAKSSPVMIGNNVWVSVQVVILSGVTIGNNSVIGACSLIRESVPADVFAAGNPLRIIKGLDKT